jgi:hypothetical protein
MKDSIDDGLLKLRWPVIIQRTAHANADDRESSFNSILAHAPKQPWWTR